MRIQPQPKFREVDSAINETKIKQAHAGANLTRRLVKRKLGWGRSSG
jgi:hypothetical protein